MLNPIKSFWYIKETALISLPSSRPHKFCEQSIRVALQYNPLEENHFETYKRNQSYYKVRNSLWASCPGRSGGGAGKGRRTRNYAGIWISASKKSMRNGDWRRWHHYPWHVFFNVSSQSRSFPIRANWRKSGRSVDGKPQGNWRWNSNSRDLRHSCKLSFFSPPRRKSLLIG